MDFVADVADAAVVTESIEGLRVNVCFNTLVFGTPFEVKTLKN